MIDTVKLFGLLLLFGAASFRFLLWPAATDRDGDALRQSTAIRKSGVMGAGLILAVAAGIPSLKDPLFGAEQLFLALLFFAGFVIGTRTNQKALLVLALIAGLGVVSMQALTTHAANEPGYLPVIASVLHWLVAIAWGGVVMHLALQPWAAMIADDEQHNARVAALTQRYANLSLVALSLLALTGGLLGFAHIHNADALNSTAYGTAYKAKALLFATLVITVSVHKIRISSACCGASSAQSLRSALRRFRRTVSIEAMVLMGLIVATSSLATGNPPGVAPFLSPQTWQLQVGNIPLAVGLQPVAGRLSQARIEIASASAESAFAEGTIVSLSMVTAAGDAGHQVVEALPIGPSAFLAEVVLAVPGRWELVVTVDYPDRSAGSGSLVIDLPGPPLQKDLRAYLNLSTIVYSRATLISFGVGVLLLLVAIWTVRLCTRGKAPVWVMPVSLGNAILGGFLILSVTFVKTYPSSFWPNPQPFTFEVVRQGDALYRVHCVDCHGITGAGDGPWAIAERGSIPDLAAPHVDTHTDGELFWWNKYGIPSLDMPAFGEKLTDDENWMVINFVRSLRHDIPPPQ